MARPRITDRDEALALVAEHGWKLQDCSDDLKRDFEVVLAAVQENGNALAYADPSLRDNEDIAYAAVEQTGYALQHIGPALRGNLDMLLSLTRVAVGQNGLALQFLKWQPDDKTEIMHKYAYQSVARKAVGQNGMALRYVSEEGRDYEPIVMAAVEKNPEALQFASERLRADPTVVGQALRDTMPNGQFGIPANVPNEIERFSLLPQKEFDALATARGFTRDVHGVWSIDPKIVERQYRGTLKMPPERGVGE